MTFRAFISVDLPWGGRLEDILGKLHLADPTLKTVDPSLMHVTLKFLGDTEESKVMAISDAMMKAIGGIAPFDIGLEGMGAFPRMDRPRVIWVGLDKAQPLAVIARRLEDLLSPLGFEPERRGFTPHLTVARARVEKSIPAVRSILEEHVRTHLGMAHVDRIRLKKSVLTRSGPIYSTVEEVLFS
jgi:RNA 2',3'-cyclic 3'-phosphodiesterase